jgi:hypothetical protein
MLYNIRGKSAPMNADSNKVDFPGYIPISKEKALAKT